MDKSELSGPRKYNHIFKEKFPVPNPLVHLSIPFLGSSGQVTLVVEQCKPDLPKLTKDIVDSTGGYEEIYLDLSMVFPSYLLVRVYTRDFIM